MKSSSSISSNRAEALKKQKQIKKEARLRYRQALFAKINQGIYDTKDELLNLIRNAEDNGESNILKAAQQRLKKRFPNTYRRYVGPLELRDPLGSKRCYCAIPSSIDSIAHDIMNQTIPEEALVCDACWDIDITYTWGVYGQSNDPKETTTLSRLLAVSQLTQYLIIRVYAGWLF